ncbi:MAG TPA: ATP synthase F0 subunit B [Candidatus Acidoferrales bacterium]|nr:ATP synthase F0 subunit B [Candidatus Acidoferrales bacterium]
MEILHSLGDLFLESVPTVIMVMVFYLLLRSTFFIPLTRVMDERKARTEGARREAEVSQAAAREKTRAYEEALRKARAAVYAEQDAARHVIMEQRASAARDARTRALERVQKEKDQIAQEVAAAHGQLLASTPQLAAEIVRTLLASNSGPRPASEAQ